ncbi:MAG: hypothetical protein HY861_03530 [Chlamydiia bacterium]|nr:hypothetical protein [Chlamydiia bacterium]
MSSINAENPIEQQHAESIQWFNANYPSIERRLQISADGADALRRAWTQGKSVVELIWKNDTVTTHPIPTALQLYSQKVQDIAVKHGLVKQAVDAGKELCTVSTHEAYQEITEKLLPETIEKITSLENDILAAEAVPVVVESRSYGKTAVGAAALIGISAASYSYRGAIMETVSQFSVPQSGEVAHMALRVTASLLGTAALILTTKKLIEHKNAIIAKLPSFKTVAKITAFIAGGATIAGGIYLGVSHSQLIKETAGALVNGASELIAGSSNTAKGVVGGLVATTLLFPVLRWILNRPGDDELPQD